MLLSNPIIIKELIQGAHRKRTYLLRVALPAMAAMILGFQIYVALQFSALQFETLNWRTVSSIARPIFVTCSWIQMITFPLMAAAFASSTLAREWTDKTVEVLCATPLSTAKIIYGKFVSVLAKIFLLGLALLPIQGIYVQLGRIPPEAVLKALGLVAATTLLFGSLALLDLTGLGRRRKRTGARIDIILVYLFVTTLPAILLWQTHPTLVAAVPFWAFHHVLGGGAPIGGMSPGRFAATAIAIPTAVSIAALALAPALFREKFKRHLGGGGGRRRRGAGRPGRVLGRRRPLRPGQHPLYWQETGPGMFLVRWAVPAMYVSAVVGTIVVAIFHRRVDYDILTEEEYWNVLAIVGLVACMILTVLWGAQIFSREKLTRTADALVLTGIPPRVFLYQKVKAILFSQRYAFLSVGVCLGIYLLTTRHAGDREKFTAFAIGASCVLGVVCSAVPTLVMSAAGRSPGQTVAAIFVSLAIAYAIAIVVFLVTSIVMFTMSFGWGWDFARHYVYPALAAAAIIAMLLINKRWTAWRLSFLLALNVLLYFTLYQAIEYTVVDFYDLPDIVAFVALWMFVAAPALGWYVLGLRVFDKCMRGEGARAGR